MIRMGICHKCGEWKMVRDHHAFGYDTDKVLPYCLSCDKKAHYKARKEGTCNLSSEQSHRKSNCSSMSRSTKIKLLSWKTVSPNVRLFERLQININTGTITVWSYFGSDNGHKLYVVGEANDRRSL